MKPFAWGMIPILFFSCSQLTKNELPNGVLPESKMIPILVGIHLAEARANVMTVHLDSARFYFAIYKDSIYKKNNVTKFEFDSSYRYYMRNVSTMDRIYMAVVDSLGLRQGLKRIN